MAETARAWSAHPLVERCSLDLCDDAGQAEAAGYAGMLEWWGGEPGADLLNGLAPSAQVYAVDELVEKAPARDAFDGIKLVAPWALKPAMDPAEGRRHWDEHVPLALSVHVGACAYVRHWVRAVLTPGAVPYQGVATLWFPTAADLCERLFDRPENEQRIAQDVEEFLGRNCVFAARELQFSRGRRRFAGSAA